MTSKQLRGLFSDCESGEYRHWLLGCRECPSGCEECKGKFIGKPDCLSCATNIFKADGECFSCDEGEYVVTQGDKLECLPCSFSTRNCIACELMNGQCSACASPFLLDSNFACACPSGKNHNEPENLCEIPATCTAAQYTDNTNSCVDCISNCVKCTDGSTCDTCATGHDGPACETCVDGYFPTFFGECEICRPNCVECTRYQTCDTCATGYTGPTCSTCAAGYTGTNCNICATGYYEDDDDECSPCIADCDTCTDDTTCDTCAEGYASPDCVTCETTGYWDDSGEC